MKILIDAIKSAGGKCLLIGGAVIDSIMNREIKDWDIEVYGLSLSQIEEVLINNGLQADMVGKAFGIIKTKVGDIDVDLSVPRRENKTGIGHKGFEVEFDPTMTPEEAGRRRDLTINSMYQDMETGEIVDPFNGKEDLENGVIRATDPKTFVEDPLRVLRIMQLLPRKGKVVDANTINLCASMVDEFNSLPSERIFEEFNKLLLKANKPSMGLEFLKECGWIKHFPELNDLVGCPQNPEWHPEGDVWEHTKLVVDMAAKLKHNLPEEWQLAYMYGAMLHDVGKPSTTDKDLRAIGHDRAGIPIAKEFMLKLTNSKTLIDRVIAIVGYHMRPGQYIVGKAKNGAWRRLHNKIRLDVIAYMSKADSLSRYGDENLPHPPSVKALKYFKMLGPEPIKPILMGRHLIEEGFKPGPQMGCMLKEAYRVQVNKGIEDMKALIASAKNVL